MTLSFDQQTRTVSLQRCRLDDTVSEEAAYAATCLSLLDLDTRDYDEFAEASVDGFKPHLRGLSEQLYRAVKEPCARTALDLFEEAVQAYDYVGRNFAPSHGTLLLAYELCQAACRLQNLDYERELAIFRVKEKYAGGRLN